MTLWHRTLSGERWATFPASKQVLMIGTELMRGQRWQELGDDEEARRSSERALELIDLTVADNRWRGKRVSLLRLRESLAEAYLNPQEKPFRVLYERSMELASTADMI